MYYKLKIFEYSISQLAKESVRMEADASLYDLEQYFKKIKKKKETQNWSRIGNLLNTSD